MTAISNRIGDLLILILIRLIVTNFSLEYIIWEKKTIKNCLLILLVARITKRAQIPFSAWLPAAMAAPTPVSSLVHSSTLVTAGIYLLIRHGRIFINKNSQFFIFYIGLLTRLTARLTAVKETDLKKIIALSTLSQLGLIFIFLGINLIKITFLHLLAHAFFKALIFIATGNLIHSFLRDQDLRRIGNITQTLRISKRLLILRRCSLIGIPFISAFYSKEYIIEILYLNFITITDIFFLFFTAILTRIYSVRFIIIFFNKSNKISRLAQLREKDILSQLSIIILALPRIIGGKFLILIIISEINNHRILATNFLSIILLLTIRILIFNLFFFKNFKFNTRFFLFRIWGLNLISRKIGRRIPIKFSKFYSKLIEKGIFIYTLNLTKETFFFFLSTKTKRIFNFFLIWTLVIIILN